MVQTQVKDDYLEKYHVKGAIVLQLHAEYPGTTFVLMYSVLRGKSLPQNLQKIVQKNLNHFCPQKIFVPTNQKKFCFQKSLLISDFQRILLITFECVKCNITTIQLQFVLTSSGFRSILFISNSMQGQNSQGLLEACTMCPE